MSNRIALFLCLVSSTTFSICADEYVLPKQKLHNTITSYWDSDLLKHDEAQIQDFIRDLDLQLISSEISTKDFWKEISRKLNNCIEYHKKHFGKTRDPNDVLSGGAKIGGALIGAIMAYSFYCIWHKPIRNQIADYYAKYNITERYNGSNNTRVISGAGQETKKLANLRNRSECFFVMEIFAAIFISAALFDGFIGIRDSRHQLRYAKLLLFKKILDRHLFLAALR